MPSEAVSTEVGQRCFVTLSLRHWCRWFRCSQGRKRSRLDHKTLEQFRDAVSFVFAAVCYFSCSGADDDDNDDDDESEVSDFIMQSFLGVKFSVQEEEKAPLPPKVKSRLRSSLDEYLTNPDLEEAVQPRRLFFHFFHPIFFFFAETLRPRAARAWFILLHSELLSQTFCLEKGVDSETLILEAISMAIGKSESASISMVSYIEAMKFAFFLTGDEGVSF